MRIRTATAAALLGAAAILGSVGTATATAHDNNRASWTSFAQDFSDRVVAPRVSSSDNDTTDVKSFSTRITSDNELKNISSGLAIGEVEVE
ncbi:hypothetical protein ACTWQF_24840 [Streptomyces sp. 8N114]|uniref:hypothetical protein n=1 Tax=Streptomyces sp. 8N114 TaxID=3457419 RepID=UPI003FD37791